MNLISWVSRWKKCPVFKVLDLAYGQKTQGKMHIRPNTGGITILEKNPITQETT